MTNFGEKTQALSSHLVANQIQFLEIAEINEKTMLGLNFVSNPAYEDYVESDRQARAFAQSLVKK
jgi:1-deoxy-D-xylulose-5-phosphate reductoisomerase